MEELFAEWRKRHEGKENSFIRDGIPFPDIYSNERKKVLFILKEPHDEKPDFEGDQIPVYREFALNESNNDFNGIMSKIGTLYDLVWGDGNGCRDAIRKIAVINLKKSGGGAQCNKRDLAEYVKHNRDLLIKQINIIAPDYIVCLGCFDLFVKCVLLDKKGDCKERWRRGNISHADTYEYRTKKDHESDKVNYSVIFSMHHPSIRRMGKETYARDFENNYKTVMKQINEIHY